MRVPFAFLFTGCVLLLLQIEASAEPAPEVRAVLAADERAMANLQLSMVRIVESDIHLSNGQHSQRRVKDSSVNGALIGAAIGAGYGIAASFHMEPENDTGAVIISMTTIGMLAGWLIDELR